MAEAEGLRLDIWLWSVRLFKTRALAAEAASKGRIHVNGVEAKPSRHLRMGDVLTLRHPGSAELQTLNVTELPRRRVSAPLAAAAYAETAESLAARQALETRRRLAPEPALTRTEGRPTKRERRTLTQADERWKRWSASIDDKS